jgi:hypothetical protein
MELSLEVSWILAFLTAKADLPIEGYLSLGFEV